MSSFLSHNKPRLLLLLSLYLVLVTTAFAVIIPPNGGPDELHHARSSWYLFENPGSIFDNQNYVTYQFPKSLLIDQDNEKVLGACLPQSQAVTSQCWISPGNEKEEARVMILYYSPLYYTIIGFFQHLSILDDPVQDGRLGNQILVLILVGITLHLLKRSMSAISMLSICWILTPPVVFLASVINPSSFEITSLLLVLACTIFLRRGEALDRSFFPALLMSQILCVLSRPISFIWLFLLILLVCRPVTLRFALIHGLIPLTLGFIVNLSLNNRSWSLAPDSRLSVTSEFYVEETIRVILNSGTWIFTMIGHLGWTEIAMPLILLLINISVVVHIYTKYWKPEYSKSQQLLLLSTGIFVVPLLVSVPYAANWPMWWSGRYSLPFFVAFFTFTLKDLTSGHVAIFRLGTINLLVMLVLTFWRYNWGLYPTNTPILANGVQLPLSRILLFAFITVVWFGVILCICGKLKATRASIDPKEVA
jgi:hypothetical protein